MTKDEVATSDQQDDAHADGAAVTFHRSRTSGESCVLAVSGDLDIAVSGQLGHELGELLDLGTERVGVDLSGVLFMDSSALSALVHANERAKAHGQRLNLLCPSSACAKVLNITGLDRVFEVRDTA